MAKRRVGRIDDRSTHFGTVITTNTDNTVEAEGKPICVEGALHSCPIPGHGVTPITGNLATKSKVNSKKMVLNGSIAGCGAIIIAFASRTYGS